jgi:hypothetical protein
MLSIDLIIEFAKVQALFEHLNDVIIINQIQEDALIANPRGLDDPAYI